MNNKREDLIFTIFEPEFKGLAIDPIISKKEIGKIEKINFPNFKWIGSKTVFNDQGNEKQVHFIEIINLPDNLIREICNTINDIINDESISIAQAINKVIDYFKKVKFQKDIAKLLIGDLAEAIFILKTLELGYDVSKHLRVCDDALYDFNVDNKLYIEVKSASSDKNEFIISNEQLEQIKNKNIVIVKFKKVDSQTNILKLYELINKRAGYLNDLLIQKQIYWNQYIGLKEEGYINNIIDDYSVVLENCRVNIFRNQRLPEYSIKLNACKKVMFHINCTDDELEKIDELIDKMKFLNKS